MSDVKYKELKEAYNKEKDLRIGARITAVNMVCRQGKSIQDAADTLLRSPAWVSKWVKRFEEGGIDALRDLSRIGRPRKIKLEKVQRIINKMDKITPAMLNEQIQNKTKVKYHITAVRKILHTLNMSPKTSNRIHANRATNRKIRAWQKQVKKKISRLKKNGFTTLIQDESIFVHDPSNGKKYWSMVGEPITVRYNGIHRRMIVCGSIATDGRRMFRTYEKSFTSKNFVSYLKELQRRFGKIHVIIDSSTTHTARIVQKYIENTKNVKITYLPTATPELSAIEEYWHQSKRDILVSEYYGTFVDMRNTLSKYLRTKSTNLDVMAYINRSLNLTNL